MILTDGNGNPIGQVTADGSGNLILLAPSWGGMINGMMTLSGAWHRTAPQLRRANNRSRLSAAYPRHRLV